MTGKSDAGQDREDYRDASYIDEFFRNHVSPEQLKLARQAFEKYKDKKVDVILADLRAKRIPREDLLTAMQFARRESIRLMREKFLGKSDEMKNVAIRFEIALQRHKVMALVEKKFLHGTKDKVRNKYGDRNE